MTPGLIALLAALAAAVIGGAAWRSFNGRMRTVRVPGSLDVPSADAVKAGNEAAPNSVFRTRAAAGAGLLTGDQLGHELGSRATLVQFSSAFCAPCRATRRILADVAGTLDGVEHVEIDAESHLDLVRKLNVLRTPTVFVLAADGRISRRASGAPRKQDVIAAIGEAMEPNQAYNSYL